MNKNMIYFYCLACFIPSVIVLFAMFFAKDFDDFDDVALVGFLCIFFLTFIFGFLFSLALYSKYFPPVSLEKLEKIEKIIMKKTNE